MAKETSTEVTTPAQGKELMHQLDIRLSDPADLALAIAQRTAMAQTPDDLFAENGSNGWQDREGEPFMVRRIYWLPSAIEGGTGFFAVVEAAHADTGELAILTTGSVGVCIQLAKAEQMGWLDKPVKLKRAEQPTSNGYYPQRLVRA